MPKTRIMRKGFTLVEVLITLAIFVVVIMAAYTIFESSHRTFASGTRKQDAQQTARLAMDEMIRKIRMAGFFPENFDAATANDIPVPPANSPFGVPRIHFATDTALAAFGDLDGANASNVFLFCLSGSQLLAKKGPAGIVDSYTCTGAGDVLADNVTNLSFTYWGLDVNRNLVKLAFGGGGALDGVNVPPFNAGAGATPLEKSSAALSFPTPGNPTSADSRRRVRVVGIQLQVTQDVPGQNAQVYSLNSTVELRNNNDTN